MAAPPDAATREAMRQYWERQRELHDFNGRRAPRVVAAHPDGPTDPLDDYLKEMNGGAPSPLIPPAAAPLYQRPPAFQPPHQQPFYSAAPPPAYAQPAPLHHVAPGPAPPQQFSPPYDMAARGAAIPPPVAQPPNFWYNAGRAAGQLGQDVQTPLPSSRRMGRRTFFGAAAAAGLGAGLLYLWNRSRVPGGTAPKEGETGSGTSGGSQTSGGTQTQQQQQQQGTQQQNPKKIFDGDVAHLIWASNRIVFNDLDGVIRSIGTDGKNSSVLDDLSHVNVDKRGVAYWLGSPDNRYVYYEFYYSLTDSEIYRVPVVGGSSEEVVDLGAINREHGIDFYTYVSGMSKDGRRILLSYKRKGKNVKLGIIDIGSLELSDIFEVADLPDSPSVGIWSPDERAIAFSYITPDGKTIRLITVDSSGANQKQIFEDPYPENRHATLRDDLLWNPDSSEFTFLRNGDLWVIKPTGTKTQLTTSGTVGWVNSWSTDGKYLLYTNHIEKGGQSFLTERLTGKMKELLPNFSVVGTAWSPDSKRIAFGGSNKADYRNGLWIYTP